MIVHCKTKHNGFSLLELMLYMAVATILVVVVSGVSIHVLQTAHKTKLLHEITYTSTFIFDTIERVASGAYSIESPIATTSSSSVTFRTYDVATDPTRIYQSGNTILITEGGGVPMLLHTSSTRGSITFTNVSAGNAPDSLAVLLHASATTHSILPAFNAEETFSTTLTLNHTP